LVNPLIFFSEPWSKWEHYEGSLRRLLQLVEKKRAQIGSLSQPWEERRSFNGRLPSKENAEGWPEKIRGSTLESSFLGERQENGKKKEVSRKETVAYYYHKTSYSFEPVWQKNEKKGKGNMKGRVSSVASRREGAKVSSSRSTLARCVKVVH